MSRSAPKTCSCGDVPRFKNLVASGIQGPPVCGEAQAEERGATLKRIRRRLRGQRTTVGVKRDHPQPVGRAPREEMGVARECDRMNAVVRATYGPIDLSIDVAPGHPTPVGS